jgi:dissimilatory sulfite reductase related protein
MTDTAEPRTSSDALDYEVRHVFGRDIIFDNEGFLRDSDDWSEELALFLTSESGLENPGEPWWRVILFLRTFYMENGRAPLNRQLKQGTALSISELEELFPGGIKHGARRLAGLPNPKTCL